MKIFDDRKPKAIEVPTLSHKDWFILKHKTNNNEFLCTLGQILPGVLQVFSVTNGDLNRMSEDTIDVERSGSSFTKLSPAAMRIVTENDKFTWEKVEVELHII